MVAVPVAGGLPTGTGDREVGVAEARDVVPDVVAQALWRDSEGHATHFVLPYPRLTGLPLSSLIRRTHRFVKQAAPATGRTSRPVDPYILGAVGQRLLLEARP
jgi:hypothetical protein